MKFVPYEMMKRETATKKKMLSLRYAIWSYTGAEQQKKRWTERERERERGGVRSTSRHGLIRKLIES